MTQLTLALDHEPSLDKLARKMADEDIIYGEHTDWDHAYECAWFVIEDHIANGILVC